VDRKIIITVGAVVIAVVIVATLLYINFMKKGLGPPSKIETIGGKYNVTLSFWNDGAAKIEYTDETGKHSEMYFNPEMRNSSDWIRANTPENSTMLCWWDYGHMIKGYAERNVIARNPSHEIIDSVACAREDPNCIKEFDSHEKISDIASAFSTSNSTETLQIMKKYNATYILVCTDELDKTWWIYHIAGLDPTIYLKTGNPSAEFTEAGKQTMLSRLLENRDTGFTLVYQDSEVKIYKTN
jgi:asparagine N-glycosylation enzyme membrane subunit Stt3